MCQESVRGTEMCRRKCCAKACKGGRQLLVTIAIFGLGPVHMIFGTDGKHCCACITQSQPTLHASVFKQQVFLHTHNVRGL